MWAEAECYALSLSKSQTRTLELVASRGRRLPLEVHRWLNDADAADDSVVDRCRPSVLDVGCGPGRMVRACADRGLRALGVDVASDAVALSVSRGGPAVHCDVFAELPVDGPWATVLLIDGNVGIGGDVNRLLTRLVELLDVEGELIVEATPDAGLERRLRVRFGVDGKARGRRFKWSVIGSAALIATAARSDLRVLEQWRIDGREFVRFGRTLNR